MLCYALKPLATFAGLCLMFHAALISAAEPLRWLPADINTVARIKVAEAFQSPIAKKENWKKKASEAFVHQESLVPPGAREIVIGAQLDLVDHMTVRQKYGILVPEGDLTMAKLADWLPHGIDEVGGKDLAQLSDGSYVIDAGDGCWLSLEGGRQNVTRWLNRGPAKDTKHLSDYLQSALSSKANSGAVMLAIDLQDNFSKEHILAQLKATKWFPSESATEKVADILASSYGITINISLDKERTGTVYLDFMKDATPIMPVLDNLVEGMMKRVGAPKEEFTDWTWTVKGTRVIGTGPVAPGGGRSLIAILDPPHVANTIAAATTTDPNQDKMTQTSLKYCKSMIVLVDDVKKRLRETKDNRALLVERYARKIDDLPKLYVDDELLNYAANVSNSLRYQGQTMRTNNSQQWTQKAQAGVNYTSFSAYGGPYGGWQYTSTNPQGAEAIEAQSRENINQVRFSEWKQIEDGLLAVRTSMTKKYQMEF